MDIRKFLNKKPRLEEVDGQSTNIEMDDLTDSERPSTSTSNTHNIPLPQIRQEIPDDIAQIGEPIRQIILKTYPRENNRAFVADWFKKFKWLQYSVKKDAAFCYPCQQFLPQGSGQASYTQKGFRNWKNATDPKTGLGKHEKSLLHIQAMSMWEEKTRRINTSTSIETLLNRNILEKHRYYVKSIIEIIQFLAVNELAFRGNYDLDEAKEKGLFNSLFEYTVKKDPLLKEALTHIPENAQYRSPEIQNQIIQAMVNTVRESIVLDIQESDVPWFTLMEDGTRDKNNRENIAIAIRYVKNGSVKESLLTVTTTKNLDAATFTEATLNILTENKIDLNRILSQCYDGASVMSGNVSGVAARIQKKIGRPVPYIHCFNHRVHLVVVRTISEMPFIRQFFDQCIMIHEFFHHGKIAALYEGKSIGRLLEQRWSGHLATTKVIFENYSLILKTLEEIKKGKFSGEDIAKSIGIKKVIFTMNFRFAMVVAKKILSLLQPADAALQARATGLKDAISIILYIEQELINLRSEEMYNIILMEAKNLIPNENEVLDGKRQVKPKQMKNFIQYGPSPSACSCRNSKTIQQEEVSFKGEYYETLDIVSAEMKRRFSNNEELLKSIFCLDDLDIEKMTLLKNLGKI